jgi:hypothetical protein
MLIPLDIFKETFWLLKENILLFIVGIIVLVGGALLPDLDNSQSSAGSTLGPLGNICTTFMQSISAIIWTLYHGRGDMYPQNQHRYFWHTAIVGVGFICLFWFGIPVGDDTIIQTFKNSEDVLDFLASNVSLLFLIIIVFMAVLCGSDMILGRIIKFFHLPKILNYIAPTAVIVYIFTISYTKLRLLGICIGFGYLFHVLEDFFADAGCPLLWPIPIGHKVWKRCHLPLTVETGSLINTIIDIVVLAIDLVLIIIICLEGRLTW